MLKLDWASHEASKYAVLRWHYSKCMPAGKLVKIGVWEDKVFKGVVIFGQGANNNLCKSFGLPQTECAELVRVALKSDHKTPVSKILKISLILLKKAFPGLKLIASYADLTNQGHFGGIYQASNWIYLGCRESKGAAYYMIKGKKVHGRSVLAKYGSEKNIPFPWEYAKAQKKFLYVFPLVDNLINKFKAISQPYPKRLPLDGTLPTGTGGANPTQTLQGAL